MFCGFRIGEFDCREELSGFVTDHGGALVAVMDHQHVGGVLPEDFENMNRIVGSSGVTFDPVWVRGRVDADIWLQCP